MEYNLVVDSGGSKLAAILYDDEFRPVSFAKSGSMRDNTTSQPVIERNVRDTMSQLFDGHDVTGIKRIGGSIPGPLVEAIRSRMPLELVHHDGEAALAMGASNMQGEALISLSGTGATTFHVDANYKGRGGLGGWGAVVFDEGSGYHIGRMACRAMILEYEGRGPKTAITKLMMDFFGEDTFQKAIWTLYNTEKVISPATGVASFSPLVDKAAFMGDKVALDILAHAGWCRAEELYALIRRDKVPISVPVTLTGGVWRGHPVFFESFVRTLDSHEGTVRPRREIVIPQFEPILGAMLLHYHEVNGRADEAKLQWFRETYPQYVFKFQSQFPYPRNK